MYQDLFLPQGLFIFDRNIFFEKNLYEKYIKVRIFKKKIFFLLFFFLRIVVREKSIMSSHKISWCMRKNYCITGGIILKCGTSH